MGEGTHSNTSHVQTTGPGAGPYNIYERVSDNLPASRSETVEARAE